MIDKKMKLIEIIAEIKEKTILLEQVNDDTMIMEELGLDSIQIINLIMAVEEKLGIEVDIDSLDFSHLRTFGSFSNFILKANPM